MAVLVSVVVLVGGSGSASAAVAHRLVGSFNGSDSPGEGFNPTGLAVDDSSGASAGDVYVADFANSVVDRFSATGGYLCQITGAGSTSGTTVSASECDSGTAGTPAGSFAALYGGAVDPSTGDIFVSEQTGGAVDEFAASGGFLSQIPVPGGAPVGTAFDAANGDVYIVDQLNRVVDQWDPSTGTLSQFAGGATNWVAVDNDPSSPSYGDVYLTGNGEVDVYDTTGTLLRSITGTPTGSFSNSLGGLAVDPTSGNLYVADLGDRVVDEFDPSGNFVGSIDAARRG